MMGLHAIILLLVWAVGLAVAIGAIYLAVGWP